MDLQNLVELYTLKGFYIFAANPDKTPATRRGFKDASNDPARLRWQFGNYNKDTWLVGVPTGQINKLLIVDVDVGKGDDPRSRDELRQFIEENYGTLPETFTVETMSGGLHLYYRIPEGVTIQSGVRYFDKTCSIDVRCEGGYVIGFDEKKYMPIDQDDINTFDTDIKDCPEWIVNFKKSSTLSMSYNSDFENDLIESEILELRSALTFIEAEDRDMWVTVGMALKSSETRQARGIWDEWSIKSDKYNPVDQEKKWKSFKPKDITIASVFHIAGERGWVTTYKSIDTPVVNVSPFSKIAPFNPNTPATTPTPTLIVTDNDIKLIKSIEEKKPFPKDLLNPPGFVGEIVNYMNSQAMKDQPILSLGAAFTVAGTLMGRKFETADTGIRPNIYCMGIADSGSGKENSRSCAKHIFYHNGDLKLAQMCSTEELASDAAIISALKESPSQLFLIDEIGRVLMTTKNPNKSSHLYAIPTTLLKVYSNSDKIMWGKSYADANKKIKISHPNLCIWGTSTGKQFYDSLTEDNLTDGLMSRLLIFESEDNNPEDRDIDRSRPPSGLIEQVEILMSKPHNILNQKCMDTEICNPLQVQIHPDAKYLFDQYRAACREMKKKLKDENRLDMLHTRGNATARKFGLILAVGRDVDCPVPIILPEHAEYAIKLTRELLDNMQHMAEYNISKSDFEKDVNLIWKIIREKKTILAHELTIMTHHLPSRQRKDVIETLKESDLISEGWYDDGTSKRKKMYVLNSGYRK